MTAAIQAPFIMVSRNQQEAEGRIEAQLDHEVNLKAELKIMALHDNHDQFHGSCSRQRERGRQALMVRACCLGERATRQSGCLSQTSF